MEWMQSRVVTAIIDTATAGMPDYSNYPTEEEEDVDFDVNVNVNVNEREETQQEETNNNVAVIYDDNNGKYNYDDVNINIDNDNDKDNDNEEDEAVNNDVVENKNETVVLPDTSFDNNNLSISVDCTTEKLISTVKTATSTNTPLLVVTSSTSIENTNGEDTTSSTNKIKEQGVVDTSATDAPTANVSVAENPVERTPVVPHMSQQSDELLLSLDPQGKLYYTESHTNSDTNASGTTLLCDNFLNVSISTSSTAADTTIPTAVLRTSSDINNTTANNKSSKISSRLNLSLPIPNIGLSYEKGKSGMLSTNTTNDDDHENDEKNNFAEIVKERTRLRRERETAAVSTLSVQVSRLEAALQGESKRRMKAIQSIRERAMLEIQQMEETIKKQIHEETILVEKRLLAVEERVSVLEQRWKCDVAAITTDLERDRRELDQQIKELYNATDRERQNRIEREKALEQQIASLTSLYNEKWTTERQERMVGINTINERFNEVDNAATIQVQTFETKIEKELQLLINDLENEINERQVNDDEIVSALNRYTQQLQQTLSYATSG